MGAIEARVLAELFRRGAPVPRPLAFDGVWLLQVAVQGQRLSQALARATPLSGEALLETALDALERCHQASMAADLARRVPPAPDAGFLLPGLAAVGKAF